MRLGASTPRCRRVVAAHPVVPTRRVEPPAWVDPGQPGARPVGAAVLWEARSQREVCLPQAEAMPRVAAPPREGVLLLVGALLREGALRLEGAPPLEGVLRPAATPQPAARPARAAQRPPAVARALAVSPQSEARRIPQPEARRIPAARNQSAAARPAEAVRRREVPQPRVVRPPRVEPQGAAAARPRASASSRFPTVRIPPISIPPPGTKPGRPSSMSIAAVGRRASPTVRAATTPSPKEWATACSWLLAMPTRRHLMPSGPTTRDGSIPMG